VFENEVAHAALDQLAQFGDELLALLWWELCPAQLLPDAFAAGDDFSVGFCEFAFGGEALLFCVRFF